MPIGHTHKHKIEVTDVLMWGGIAIIILWAIGKSIGWISSPTWVEMIPVYGAAAALSGISISIGKTLQKLDTVINKVEQLDQRILAVETRIP